MTAKLIFLIDSGPALDLCRQVIANRKEVAEANRAYVMSYGCTEYQTSGWTGRVRGLRFDGERHPDFKKPDREGCCEPRVRTKAWLEMNALPEHIDEAELIARTMGVPIRGNYEYGDGYGACHIGHFHACGFIWLDSKVGPFGMWIPDVAAYVARMEADGYTVTGPAKTFFKPEFEGCRRIEREEWDLMVAQHRLAKKMAQSEVAV
jgi:hypothetical protein